jgi:Arc/MetJ-type ribon-helix-helix transcriptional regulator
MKRDMEEPIRRSRGRPRIDKFWAVDALITNGAEELLRTGRYRSPSAAVREFIRQLWSGDRCAVLAILAAANAHDRDAVLDDLHRFRPQAIGQSQEAVLRRVLRRMEPTVTRYRGGIVVGRPQFGGVLGRALDRRRGPRRAVD